MFEEDRILRPQDLLEFSENVLSNSYINLTLQRTMKNSLSRAGFELASSGF